MEALLIEVQSITNQMLVKAKEDDWDAVFELEESRLKIFLKLKSEQENLSVDQKAILEKIHQSTQLIQNLADQQKSEVKSTIKTLLKKKNAKKDYK